MLDLCTQYNEVSIVSKFLVSSYNNLTYDTKISSMTATNTTRESALKDLVSLELDEFYKIALVAAAQTNQLLKCDEKFHTKDIENLKYAVEKNRLITAKIVFPSTNDYNNIRKDAAHQDLSFYPFNTAVIGSMYGSSLIVAHSEMYSSKIRCIALAADRYVGNNIVHSIIETKNKDSSITLNIMKTVYIHEAKAISVALNTSDMNEEKQEWLFEYLL